MTESATPSAAPVAAGHAVGRWSARHAAMLEAMGLRLWQPAQPQAQPQTEPKLQTAPAAVPDSASAATPVLPTASPRVNRSAGAEAEPAAEYRASTPQNGAAGGAQESRQSVQPGFETSAPTRQPSALSASRASAPGPAPAPTLSPAPIQSRPLAPASAPGEREQRISQLEWAGLQDEVAQCRACGLCEKRRNTVFGVGLPQAKWMLVGEAPGEQEDRQGEPFVGPAGQLLDQILATLGLDRHAGTERQATAATPPAEPVFIANTLKCRPPNNRNPSAEELASCAPLLHRQIELVQPRLLVATGRFAIDQLLGSTEAIGRLRSRVHHYQRGGLRIPVIVTYHPSYLLRQPTEKARAWEDWCLAMDTFLALPP